MTVETAKQSRLYDLAAASPLIVFYSFAVAGLAIKSVQAARGWSSFSDTLTIANNVSIAVFYGLQVTLCLIRRMPLAKSAGIVPRLVAIASANFNVLLLVVPRALPTLQLQVASSLLANTGILFAIWTLSHLGRSFAILPEARGLVTVGPYRLVRHPLYLAEALATFGIALLYRQPWALMIATASIGLQLWRIGFEEDVLRRADPRYTDYEGRTARLIPGIY